MEKLALQQKSDNCWIRGTYSINTYRIIFVFKRHVISMKSVFEKWFVTSFSMDDYDWLWYDVEFAVYFPQAGH